MNYREIDYSSKEQWHDIRRTHIGGSDVSIIMGENPFNSDIQKLWRIKTGRIEQEDISNNPAVKRGVDSENLLIEHFKINNPDYIVSKLEKTLESLKYPFMSANLDGVLENENGEKGVLEIKTSTCHSWSDFKKYWFDKDGNPQPPIHYYLQVQHYLKVTGWKYAILYADIKLVFAANKHEIRQYFIERDEPDIKKMMEAEIWFNSLIINDIEPPYIRKLG